MRIDVGNTMSIHLLSIIFSLLACGKRGFFLVDLLFLSFFDGLVL